MHMHRDIYYARMDNTTLASRVRVYYSRVVVLLGVLLGVRSLTS